MKKLITMSFILVTVAFSAVSCKSHERCPAYGKAVKTSKV